MYLIYDRLTGGGGRLDMHHYIDLALWRDGAYACQGSCLYPLGEFVRLFERRDARSSDDDISEEFIAGASHAHTAYLGDAFDLFNGFFHLRCQGSRGTIQKRIYRISDQSYAHPDYNGRDSQRGDSIGLPQPGRKVKAVGDEHY